MARKNDAFYFDGFRDSSGKALEAARLLSDVMHDYEPAHLHERMEQMHRIEQSAD